MSFIDRSSSDYSIKYYSNLVDCLLQVFNTVSLYPVLIKRKPFVTKSMSEYDIVLFNVAEQVINDAYKMFMNNYQPWNKETQSR